MAKVSTDSLVQTIQKIETNLPAVLIKCSVSDALDHWKNREDYPDFWGFAIIMFRKHLFGQLNLMTLKDSKKYIEIF